MTPPKPDLVAIRARLTFAINKRAASLMIDTDALSALLAYAERLDREASPAPWDDKPASQEWHANMNANAALMRGLRNAAPALIAAARDGLRLKGLQHENSVLMQSRRTLIQLNDRYREVLEWIAKGPTWGPGAPTAAEQLGMASDRARAALTPEASHD